MMNQGKIQLSQTHIGCFFHLKQAWRKYLVCKIRMDEAAVKEGMRKGRLDLLCIIPRDEIVPLWNTLPA